MAPIELLVPLSLDRQIPSRDVFNHHSSVHGQPHVGRVLINASVLCPAVGATNLGPALWASVWLHDIARIDDNDDEEHGARAVEVFRASGGIKSLFLSAGVTADDFSAICTAVEWHSLPDELPRSHPHARLTHLLKDADALDRVRLGDLDRSYLRFPESVRQIAFAESLYDASEGWEEGVAGFASLWQSVASAQTASLPLDVTAAPGYGSDRPAFGSIG